MLPALHEWQIEQEEVTTQRILLENSRDQCMKAIIAQPHIHVSGGEIDARCCAESEHALRLVEHCKKTPEGDFIEVTIKMNVNSTRHLDNKRTAAHGSF